MDVCICCLHESHKNDKLIYVGKYRNPIDPMGMILFFMTIPPLKFNSLPLKSYLPNRKVVFNPSFLRGELLNFGCVIFQHFWCQLGVKKPRKRAKVKWDKFCPSSLALQMRRSGNSKGEFPQLAILLVTFLGW